MEPSQDSSFLFSKYENFLFDLDGVLWQGPHILESAIKFV